MGRYDESFDETWVADAPKNKGFPYTFPFVFDRDEDRFANSPD